jgi:hypothetical protein
VILRKDRLASIFSRRAGTQSGYHQKPFSLRLILFAVQPQIFLAAAYERQPGCGAKILLNQKRKETIGFLVPEEHKTQKIIHSCG